MNQIEHEHQGIVPAITRLRKLFEELADAIVSQRKGKLTNERLAEMEEKIALYANEVQTLPETINRSYELIQLVIQSIHTSRSELKKSVDGLIKKTGMQLQKVTSTTEEATNKILDVAEKLDEDQMKIIALIEDIEASAVGTGSESNAAKFEEIKSKIYQNQESAFLIMDHLQFQDITAQQIAGAYSLLSDTEKTLLYVSDMLKRFDTDREKFEGAIGDVDRRSFNLDASYSDKRVLQEAIDDLFEGGDIEGDLPETEREPDADRQPDDASSPASSQDDIDALFQTGGQSEGESTSQDDIDALFNNTGKDEQTKSSQEDIDALFNNGKKEETTQDEIDKLFS